MHVHGAIAKQADLTAALISQPAAKKGGATLTRPTGSSIAAQKNASDEAAQAAQVEPKGLFFNLKSSVGRKSSDDTEEESNPGNSSPSPTEAHAPATTDDAEATASSGDAGLQTTAGQLYTARGSLSGAPSVGGSVFQATV